MVDSKARNWDKVKEEIWNEPYALSGHGFASL